MTVQSRSPLDLTARKSTLKDYLSSRARSTTALLETTHSLSILQVLALTWLHSWHPKIGLNYLEQYLICCWAKRAQKLQAAEGKTISQCQKSFAKVQCSAKSTLFTVESLHTQTTIWPFPQSDQQVPDRSQICSGPSHPVPTSQKVQYLLQVATRKTLRLRPRQTNHRSHSSLRGHSFHRHLINCPTARLVSLDRAQTQVLPGLAIGTSTKDNSTCKPERLARERIIRMSTQTSAKDVPKPKVRRRAR